MNAATKDLAEFLSGYAECAVWASTTGDDSGTPLDDLYSVRDLTADAWLAMLEDCGDFLEHNVADLESYCVQRGCALDYAGHDFWLTRNRHGAGFWDRELGALGERLAVAAHPYGESYLYVSDAGALEAS